MAKSSKTKTTTQKPELLRDKFKSAGAKRRAAPIPASRADSLVAKIDEATRTLKQMAGQSEHQPGEMARDLLAKLAPVTLH